MEAFEYATPANAHDAVKLLGSGPEGSEVLAGGSDVLARMKDFISTPGRLVSLRDARDLRGITYSSGQGLRLGSMVTLAEIAENAEVRRHYPGLVQASEDLGSPQIRSVGTVVAISVTDARIKTTPNMVGAS